MVERDREKAEKRIEKNSQGIREREREGDRERISRW